MNGAFDDVMASRTGASEILLMQALALFPG
jgi:hypothetical protein